MTDDGMPDQPGPRRQTEIYMQGMADVTPDVPVRFEDLEAAALDALDGADGVRAVGENFLADLDLTLGLAGRDSVADLDRSLLREREGWG